MAFVRRTGLVSCLLLCAACASPSREELLDEIWGTEYLSEAGSVKEQEKRIRTVDVHVRRLREKIEKDDTHPEYIMTQWGVGYYFAQ